MGVFKLVPNPNEETSRGKARELWDIYIGKVESEEDLVIHGTVHGVVVGKGKIYISDTGTIEGVVSGEEVCIAGHARGQIIAEDTLIITRTAQVNGNFKAKELFIEDGALINNKEQLNAGMTSFISYEDFKAKQLFIEVGSHENVREELNPESISFSETTLSRDKLEATEEAKAPKAGSELPSNGEVKTSKEKPKGKDSDVNHRLW